MTPALSAALSAPPEGCSRPEVVKLMWVYIKARGLQDPKDKRKIVLDDALRGVFKVKSFNMFTMNRFLSRHLWEEEVSRGDALREWGKGIGA